MHACVDPAQLQYHCGESAASVATAVQMLRCYKSQHLVHSLGLLLLGLDDEALGKERKGRGDLGGPRALEAGLLGERVSPADLGQGAALALAERLKEANNLLGGLVAEADRLGGAVVVVADDLGVSALVGRADHVEVEVGVLSGVLGEVSTKEAAEAVRRTTGVHDQAELLKAPDALVHCGYRSEKNGWRVRRWENGERAGSTWVAWRRGGCVTSESFCGVQEQMTKHILGI